MDLIPSFSTDHTRIIPGIFVSRVDTVGTGLLTTYDVRVTKPNKEPGIEITAMHSLEHLIATYLRNDPDWKDEVIYWGPMGCLTGFYLILKGNRKPQEIHGLLLKAFQSVSQADSVPGTNEENCGNYRLHNLDFAKYYAERYAAYLEAHADDQAIFEYPRTERLITEKGQDFYDS